MNGNLSGSEVIKRPNGSFVRFVRALLPKTTGSVRDEQKPHGFRCYGCEGQFSDSPPLLTVRYEGAELCFCTDGCALDEGFAVGVDARRLAELDGEVTVPFVWVDDRYAIAVEA